MRQFGHDYEIIGRLKVVQALDDVRILQRLQDLDLLPQGFKVLCALVVLADELERHHLSGELYAPFVHLSGQDHLLAFGNTSGDDCRCTEPRSNPRSSYAATDS